VSQALDRTIDAYARAVALHKDPAQKKVITDVLAPLYKGRHESEAGLQDYIASVLNRPLPIPGQPVTPAATPTSTGTTTPPTTSAPTTTTGGNTAATSTTTAQPAGSTAKPASTTTTPNTNGAKPSTPTPKP
jgi:hypothetical protein